MLEQLQSGGVWRAGVEFTQLFDWDAISAILLIFTLLATIHLANRQSRLQTRREGAAIKGLSLLLEQWAVTFGVCSMLVASELYEEAKPSLAAASNEIGEIDILALPSALAITALVETRAAAATALEPPTLGEILPGQAKRWELALTDTRNLARYWSQMLAIEARKYEGRLAASLVNRKPTPRRPVLILEQQAKELLAVVRSRQGAEDAAGVSQ